ncbi:hypothetical protein ABZP36_015265 [Zizania latifolia]
MPSYIQAAPLLQRSFMISGRPQEACASEATMASVNSGEVHVRVVSQRLVKASDESMEPHVLAVSNLDLVPQTRQVAMFCIYPKPSTGDFHDVVAAFVAGLPSLLNHFFPMAGRIVANPSSGLPEVHCRNQGAELVVGEVDVALSSLDYGTVGASIARIMVPYTGDVALSVQVVSFSCGGFTVTWGTNHVVMDGNALSMLMTACASLDKAFTPLDDEHMVNVLTSDHSFVVRLYYIGTSDIALLRVAASLDGAPATRVQAVSAYLWKALANIVGAREARCRMGWWVDGRRRLTAPELSAAMRNYVGNFTTLAIREASVEEIRSKQLPEELVDWVEDHKAGRYVETATVGLGSPTVTVSALSSFPLDTDFGFGHAAMAVPASVSCVRLCSGSVRVVSRPGGDGSWLACLSLWLRLAAALDSDEQRVFKPVTAELLGIKSVDVSSRRNSRASSLAGPFSGPPRRPRL